MLRFELIRFKWWKKKQPYTVQIGLYLQSIKPYIFEVIITV